MNVIKEVKKLVKYPISNRTYLKSLKLINPVFSLSNYLNASVNLLISSSFK